MFFFPQVSTLSSFVTFLPLLMSWFLSAEIKITHEGMINPNYESTYFPTAPSSRHTVQHMYCNATDNLVWSSVCIKVTLYKGDEILEQLNKKRSWQQEVSVSEMSASSGLTFNSKQTDKQNKNCDVFARKCVVFHTKLTNVSDGFDWTVSLHACSTWMSCFKPFYINHKVVYVDVFSIKLRTVISSYRSVYQENN